MVPSCKARMIRRKLHGLNPNPQRWNRTLLATASTGDAVRTGAFDFCAPDPSPDRRSITNRCKGMNGTPTGREPYGDGVLVVVDGVTSVQGARESRGQGEGGQVTRHTQQGRHARCGAPKPFWASFESVADASYHWKISIDNCTTLISISMHMDDCIATTVR